MKKQSTIFSIISLFLLISCGNTKEISVKSEIKNDTNVTTKDSTIVNPVFSIVDSLNKYSEADSIVIEHQGLNTGLFIGKLNECNIGVQWIEKPINIIFFQKINEKWITDTAEFYFENCYVKREDINGDDIKDAVVFSPSGSAGNLQNLVYLFNPKQKKFVHNPEYDLENVQYDKENKFLRSWRYTGVTHCQTKEKYIIKGEHVIFDSGITYCPNEETMGETGTIQYYKIINGKKIVTRTLSDKYDKMYKRFDQTFWDSREEALYP